VTRDYRSVFPGYEEILPMEEVERRAIVMALRVCKGHVGATAAALEIGTATLYRKIKRYGIEIKKAKRRVVYYDQVVVDGVVLE